MNSPCLEPPYRSEAFAEDLDPPAPVQSPSHRRTGLLIIALVPMVLTLASGAAAWLTRGA